MKKTLTIATMLLLATLSLAQSSEAGYPVGTWQSNPEAKVFVDITIERLVTPDPTFGNKLSCGSLSIDGTPSCEAMLTYAGRGLDKDGMPMNTFFFNVITKNNKRSQIVVQKMAKAENEYGNYVKIKIIKVTGDLASNPALKQQLYSVGTGNGAAYDPTPWVLTDIELLDALKEGLTNGWRMNGFGNVRQYVNAHAKLTPGMPKYAKCKSTGSINIRKSGEANAEKIGELKSGTTLLVLDEYNGWVQVKMEERKFGWVSLSVVALTNTPSATTKVNTISDEVRGDLGIFDLKGPVKSFVFKNQWGTTTRTFDRNGIWLTKDGQSLKQIYPNGIKRDNNGRLVKGIMDADGNGEEYYYNTTGRITKRSYHEFDTLEDNTYTYDANGKLLKMHVIEGGMDAAPPYTEVYEIQATDKYGNWTKRITKIGTERSVVTRTITYYE